MTRKDDTRQENARADEGRLARWSRLKREAVAEKKSKAELPPDRPDALVAARTPTATAPEAGEAERQKKINDATKDLPPIESLGKESDYSLFMREGVPEETRTAALRKLWRSDPAYREPFPYEMHMEDYNKTFVPINAATDTLFRAGLGYLFDDEKDKAAKPEVPAGEGNRPPPATSAAEGTAGGRSAESLAPPEEKIEPTGSPRSASGEQLAENQILLRGKSGAEQKP